MSPTELDEVEIKSWRRETDGAKYKKRAEREVPGDRSLSGESHLYFFSWLPSYPQFSYLT